MNGINKLNIKKEPIIQCRVQLKIMKKIPFWETKPKYITTQEQPTLAYSPSSLPHNPAHLLIPLSSVQMSAIFIDHNYQIYSTSIDNASGETLSMVYDKTENKNIKLGYYIHACGSIGLMYWIVVSDESNRYDVLTTNVDKVCDILMEYEEKPDNCKETDTQIKPLRKVNETFYVSNKLIYVVGSGPIYQWEFTSPVWMYSIPENQWKQVTDNSALKIDSKMLQKQYIKQGKRWMFPLQQTLLIITGQDITAKYIKHNFAKEPKEIPINFNGLQKTMNPFTIQPENDSFLYHYFVNFQHCVSLLLLVKTNTSQRPPLLLEVSLVKNSNDIYVNIIKLDLGIFLYNNPNNNLYKLWEVINEVVFMNLYVPQSSQSSSMNSTATNFTKKSLGHPKLKSTDKKSITLQLYTKTMKNSTNSSNSWSNSPASLRLYVHSIDMSLLQILDINESNIPLSKYFQDKEYSDMAIQAQKKEIVCSIQLFEFHSPKFKKLFATSANVKSQGPPIVKLENTKFYTAYFLVQQLYYELLLPLKNIDPINLIEIMILAQKFQITTLQALIEQQIQIKLEYFSKLYDYFRNSQTPKFREELLKFFIMHSQEIIKTMPIGKVQELIRLTYSPQCAHTNVTELKGKLQNSYFLKDSQTGETRLMNKYINYAGIIKAEQVVLKICLKCSRLLGFNHESHRKNKSSVRGNSMGSFGHKRKDNNSN